MKYSTKSKDPDGRTAKSRQQEDRLDRGLGKLRKKRAKKDLSVAEMQEIVQQVTHEFVPVK